MAERNKHIRQALIEAGIREINIHGVTAFSIRRVAQACGVSCAAPYKHFKDKREFILAIIKFVNEQWYERQQQILTGVKAAGGGLRQQIVAISVQYIRFLMDKPHFRSILMLKDEQFDNTYHRVRGQLSSTTQQLAAAYFAERGVDQAVQDRMFFVIRSLIFGAVLRFDIGEMPYSDESMALIEASIDREFDL